MLNEQNRTVPEALLAEVTAAGAVIERARHLPPELVRRLAEAGLWRLLVPRAAGGEEVELPVFARTIERIAAADASTAWCLYQCNVTALAAALCLAPDAVTMIFSDPGAVVASGAGDGVATAAPDGDRVSGRWVFASGIHGATWLAANTLDRAGAAAGEPLTGEMYVVPAAAVGDDWDVSGLRGTGSVGYRLDDVLVPSSFGAPYTPLDPLPGPAPIGRLPTETLYGDGVGVAAVALGLGSASLEALVDLAAVKTPRVGSGPLRDRPSAQAAVGRADAALGAARGYLLGLKGSSQHRGVGERTVAGLLDCSRSSQRGRVAVVAEARP